MNKLFFIIVSLLVVSGCATSRLSDAEMTAVVEEFVVEQKLERDRTVSAFSLDSYAELNDQYLTFRDGSRYYLIKVVPRCTDLAFSAGLVLNRRFGNTLSEGSDYVYVPDSLPFKCYINQIYPLSREQNDLLRDKIKVELNEKALKQDEPQESSDSE